MKKQTLLQKAKSYQIQRKQSKLKFDDNETIEIALAWSRNEITYTQAQVSITGRPGGMTAYVRLAIGLKLAIQKGKLK